jgi:hypothetical protein
MRGDYADLMASSRSPRPSERWGAGLVTTLQAGLFAVAGILLPWRFDPLFTTACLAFAALSAGTAALLLVAHRRALEVWRLQAFVGLGVLALYTGLFVASGAYLAGLYGPLGLGLAAAIQLLLAPGFLFVLPASVWAIAVTGGLRRRAGAAVVAALALAVASEAAYWWVSQRASEPRMDVDAWRADLQTASATASAALPVHRGDPFDCRAALADGSRRLALVAYRTRFSEAQRCVGAPDLDELRHAVARQLRDDEAVRPVKLDLGWRRDDLVGSPELAASFRLRAGRDGACGRGRCLAPWQLMATDAYMAYQPVPVIPDLRIGVDPGALRTALSMPEAPEGANAWSGLSRARTESFVLDTSGDLVRLDRFRRAEPTIDDREAVARAERFLIANQRGDGRFNYLVDPFDGPVRTRNFSIARQAGTAFALCEWGSDAVRGTAEAALRHLSRFARRVGAGVALLRAGATRARLGPTSLSLAAFGMCRQRFGFTQFDALVVEMAKFVSALQDPDTGRFAPHFDLASKEPVPGPHQLYADGQAILALSLLVDPAAGSGLLGEALDHEALEAAVRSAMAYTAGPYWPWPLRSFFFLEENWHCLAAKAATRVADGRLRNDGYEQLCLDLVRWRARLVQTGPAGDRGAYHFAHVSAPYTTPTAGFLEAGSAALELAKLRREPAPEIEAGLERAMDFMVRAQWDEAACFACTTRLPMVGAYSESLASTVVRVDFVQHAMAGLAGARHALER